jgi:aspartate kinase
MLVMKFGGSSVADRTQIEKVQEIVRGRLPRTPVVVCSAHKGITNMLIAAGKAAAAGQQDAEREVIKRQQAIARSCGCPDGLLASFFQELTDLLRGVRLVRELSPRSLDYISSFGERMSVRVIAHFFEQNGLAARPFDVWDLGFITDNRFGAARPLPGYEGRMAEAFARLVSPGVTPIVTGFVGKTEAGEVTTVGRNGSDLTATLVAAALGAQEAEIWSDTDGVMSADPHLVPGARNIPRMSFDEAAELAYFGSRVLHPETLIPAMRKDIPVRVLNTNRPEHPGTVITREPGRRERTVTSIAYKESQSILTVRSEHMFAHSGFLARLFEATTRRGLVVDMVTTSEVSVSISASDTDLLRAVASDIEHLGSCRIDTQKTILAVVGHHLPTQAGAAAHITSAVADAGVNIEMLSYSSGSINVSMVIDDRDVDVAVRTLHTKLFGP